MQRTCDNGDASKIEQFIQRDPRCVNMRLGFNRTPLIYVCSEATYPLDIVKLLINNGANVNYVDSLKRPAVYQTSQEGHLNVVKCLVEAGADVDLKDDFQDDTAIAWAARLHDTDVVRFLLPHVKQPKDELVEPFMNFQREEIKEFLGIECKLT